MINHTDIPFHDSNLAEIKRVLDRLAPHEHPDGRNECAICDQGLDEAILVELRDSLALRGIIREALRLLSGSDGAGGWHEARRVLEQARVTGSRNSQEGETTGQLLPCPYCGNEAELTGGPEWWVVCKYVGVCQGNMKGGCTFKEDAIRIWNRRASWDQGALEVVLAEMAAEALACEQPMPKHPITESTMKALGVVFRSYIQKIRDSFRPSPIYPSLEVAVAPGSALHRQAHEATISANTRGEFNGYPDQDAARRYYERGFLKCLTTIRPTTEAGVLWCNSHQRPAAGPNGCAQGLAGSLAICRVVFAPIAIEHFPGMLDKRAAIQADIIGWQVLFPDKPAARQLELSKATEVLAEYNQERMRRGQCDDLANELRERASQAPPPGLIIIDPKEAFRCGDEHWRDLTDPQIRVKAGDMAREANDDTWTDVPPSWIDTRIGDHQRVHFRRQTHLGLTDTEIVNRLNKHFLQVNVTLAQGATSNYRAIFIHRGALRQRAIEIPE